MLNPNAQLISCCQNGDITGAIMALGMGADATYKDDDGRNAVMYAAYNGYNQILVLFFAQEIDLNIVSDGDYSALDYACKNGKVATAKLLVEHGAKLHDKDSVLMFVCEEGSLELAKIAIDGGADVNFKGQNGMTNLMYTAWLGHFELAEYLIENGADINAQADNGYTALKFATSYEHENLVELLKKNGATF